MADIAPALAYLAPDEGGYTVDSGGPTNFGITAPYALATIGYSGDMSLMTYDQATQAYNIGTWTPLGLAGLTSQEVANAIFDIAVDVGNGGIGAVVQTALSDPSIAWSGSNDGNFGPETLAGVQAADPDTFIIAFAAAALANYQALAAGSATNAAYLNGWTNRANRLLQLQTGLAGYVALAVNNPWWTAALAGVVIAGLIGYLGESR